MALNRVDEQGGNTALNTLLYPGSQTKSQTGHTVNRDFFTLLY